MIVDVDGRSLDDGMLSGMCSSKFRYGSKAKAKKRLKTLNGIRAQKGDDPLRVYHCPVCGGWHFTSKEKKR